VLCVKDKIHETGVDMFFDIHGDEALPYNFVAGNEMLADFTPERMERQKAFIDQYMAASPDFQNVYGYAASKYNEELLTLEMPFKDNADLPDAYTGWNGARSSELGAAILQPILKSLD
jgi:murein tripeptide amidase MpaA